MFLLTYKRSLAQSANSQQPTANSQQPTANSQQPNFNQSNILFYVNKFINEESSLGKIFAIRSHCKLSVGCSFFMSIWCFDRLSNRFDRLNLFQHPRKKEILKQVQNDIGKNLPVWEVKINYLKGVKHEKIFKLISIDCNVCIYQLYGSTRQCRE